MEWSSWVWACLICLAELAGVEKAVGISFEGAVRTARKSTLGGSRRAGLSLSGSLNCWLAAGSVGQLLSSRVLCRVCLVLGMATWRRADGSPGWCRTPLRCSGGRASDIRCGPGLCSCPVGS